MANELLRYNRQINDLAFYGIEGDHYQAVGDKQYKTLANTTSFPAYAVCPWAWKTSIERTSVQSGTEYSKWMKVWDDNKQPVSSILQTFNLNDSSIKNEIAALSALSTQYGVALGVGLAGDPEKILNEYKGKQKTAGIDKVKDEVQKQIDAYLKASK